jgi:hypothetical protein
VTLLEVTQLKRFGRRFSQIYADNNFKSAFISVYLRPKFVTIQPSCPNAFIGHPFEAKTVDSR